MKILFINTVKLDKNGISTFILNNAKYLSRSNKVSILASNKVDPSIKSFLQVNGISLIEILNRNKKPLQYFEKLIRTIRNESFDVIHVNGNSSTMVVELLAAKLAGCKYRVAHAHNTVTEHTIIHNLLYPIFNACLTTRMACSKSAGQWLYRGKDFYVINNGVDIREYKPELKTRNIIRNRYKIKKSDILLGNIGLFNFQKNQQFLIPIIEKLDKKYKLLLIGEGPLKKTVKRSVDDHKLNSRVFFAGKVDNVKDYLSAIDLFVMPSNFEGLPFALVEAQASGLQCIVSNKVSKESNLTKNVNFISLNNVNAWVDMVLHLSKDYLFESRVASLNKIHQEIRNRNYDAQKNAKYLENIFKELLK